MHLPQQHLLHYDSHRRRLWVAGQRCHHGAAGTLLTAVAGAGLVASIMRTKGIVALAAAGSLLMVHDWKDRSIWFERGWQDQP